MAVFSRTCTTLKLPQSGSANQRFPWQMHSVAYFWLHQRFLRISLVVVSSSRDPFCTLQKRVCAYNLHPTCAQVSTTKGTGGDVIILEEAAYCDPQFFYETVAPLLLIGRTSLLGISTLTSEINFYSRLIKMKDPLTQARTLSRSLSLSLLLIQSALSRALLQSENALHRRARCRNAMFTASV